MPFANYSGLISTPALPRPSFFPCLPNSFKLRRTLPACLLKVCVAEPGSALHKATLTQLESSCQHFTTSAHYCHRQDRRVLHPKVQAAEVLIKMAMTVLLCVLLLGWWEGWAPAEAQAAHRLIPITHCVFLQSSI